MEGRTDRSFMSRRRCGPWISGFRIIPAFLSYASRRSNDEEALRLPSLIPLNITMTMTNIDKCHTTQHTYNGESWGVCCRSDRFYKSPYMGLPWRPISHLVGRHEIIRIRSPHKIFIRTAVRYTVYVRTPVTAFSDCRGSFYSINTDTCTDSR